MPPANSRRKPTSSSLPPSSRRKSAPPASPPPPPAKTPARRPSKSNKGGAPKNPKRRRLLIALAALAVCFLIGTGILVGVLDEYGSVDRARKADAIVILGAQVRADGQPGLGLRMRIDHAYRLYKKGIAPRIICTGGRGTYPPAEAEAAAKVLRQKGVPAGDIFIEDQSTSTWENALYATEICRARGWKTVVLSSDPFHLWRGERNFRRCGVQAYGSPVAREMWQKQPTRKFLWTAREALLVMRDWCLRRV